MWLFLHRLKMECTYWYPAQTVVARVRCFVYWVDCGLCTVVACTSHHHQQCTIYHRGEGEEDKSRNASSLFCIILLFFCAVLWHCWLGGRKGIRPVKMGWWRWSLLSPDGVAPIRMVGVSASVNLLLHHKVQKFSSGTGSPGWSRKKGRKTVVVVCRLIYSVCTTCLCGIQCLIEMFRFKLVYHLHNQLCFPFVKHESVAVVLLVDRRIPVWAAELQTPYALTISILHVGCHFCFAAIIFWLDCYFCVTVGRTCLLARWEIRLFIRTPLMIWWANVSRMTTLNRFLRLFIFVILCYENMVSSSYRFVVHAGPVFLQFL